MRLPFAIYYLFELIDFANIAGIKFDQIIRGLNMKELRHRKKNRS